MGLPVAGGHATNLVALNRMALTSKSAEISNAARAPDMKPLISSIGEPNSATRKKFAVGGDSAPACRSSKDAVRRPTFRS
jgi:hypothetical protein